MMNNSIFNPDRQQQDISGKIVTGLERISEVFKALLWQKAKQTGLSPIQIQILIFIAFHKQELCNVSHLAKEFNITKPTISDAVKVLEKKALIYKDFSLEDNRSYIIRLSESGKKTVSETSDFARPLKAQIDHFETPDLESVYSTLSELIHKLNQIGLLTVQRTCYGCAFYQKNDSGHYCRLLQKELQNKDIRLDCAEYLQKADNA